MTKEAYNNNILFLPSKLNYIDIFLNSNNNILIIIIIIIMIIIIVQFWSRFIPINRGWPDLPRSNSNLSNSHSPSCLIQGILLLQNNNLALLLSLCLPHLLWSSSLPLALHFKVQPFSQNMPIIPSQHIPIPSHSIRLCHLNHFPSIPTSPLGPLSSFSPSVLHHTLLSRSLSKILHNTDKPFLSS